MNGGTCIDGVDNFTCSCPPKLTGPLCECLILDDGSHDCEYVSPTPGSTQSVFTTIIFEGSTDVISTSNTYNDTIGRTMLTTESDNFTSIGVLTTEHETETTTPQIITSTVSYLETVTNENIVTEEFTKQTIKLKTTTELSPTNPPSPPTIPDTTTDSVTLKTTKDSSDDVTSTELTVTTDKEITAEITSTPKADSTTDKMFTDTPTEHSTEQVTPPTLSTTEVTAATDTQDYSTMQSECTDSYCNNHGTCVNSPNGIRVSQLFERENVGILF